MSELIQAIEQVRAMQEAAERERKRIYLRIKHGPAVDGWNYPEPQGEPWNDERIESEFSDELVEEVHLDGDIRGDDYEAIDGNSAEQETLGAVSRLLCEIAGLYGVKIENAYEDGHESESVVYLAAPSADQIESEEALAPWWEEIVYPSTGDGHGVDGMGSCYTATIISAPVPDMIGKTYEWLD